MNTVPVYYADNRDVKPVGNSDYNDYVKDRTRRQELPGFDPQYLDIVDYILTITHQIWEEHGTGVIFDCYHNDVMIHTITGTAKGIWGSVAGTLATLHSFPDRRLIGEDVVWAENKPGEYFSSHRILSTATNTGDSAYGPATGKRAFFRTIADCVMSDNRIFEEWLMRDNLAIVQQLGFDPKEVAKNMAKTMPAHKITGIPESSDGQFYPQRYKAQDGSLGEMFKEYMMDIYNGMRFNRVPELFTENAVVHTVGNQDLVGHDEIQAAMISLRSSFPAARYIIDRITINDQTDGSFRVAVRWKLRGLHEGIGMYGAPTGKMVYILGATHFNVVDGKVNEAWEVYDALDVMRQLAVIDDEEA